MDKEYVISKIINLPKDFYERGGTSITHLLKESGYSSIAPLISRHDIFQNLQKNPGLANEWLIYSENERLDKGWYFKQIDDMWEINYWPSNGIEKQKIYSGFLEACATYILLKINEIAKYF